MSASSEGLPSSLLPLQCSDSTQLDWKLRTVAALQRMIRKMSSVPADMCSGGHEVLGSRMPARAVLGPRAIFEEPAPELATSNQCEGSQMLKPTPCHCRLRWVVSALRHRAISIADLA